MPAKAKSTYNVLELHRNIVQSQGHDTWYTFFYKGNYFNLAIAFS